MTTTATRCHAAHGAEPCTSQAHMRAAYRAEARRDKSAEKATKRGQAQAQGGRYTTEWERHDQVARDHYRIAREVSA